MDLADLKNKLVAVIGYGREGKAVARFLLDHGIVPTLFDRRPWDDWSLEEQAEITAPKLNFIFGPDYLKELRGFDVAFRSPGVWRLQPRLLEEEQGGMKITSQTKWFFEHRPGSIIGVTGTKGKGTTSALIHAMFNKGGNNSGNVYLTGNIGQQDPLTLLKDLRPDDLIVFELSSFQLQDLNQSPHMAVVLMITSEHLDVHRSRQEYTAAKQQIVKYQTAGDFAVINQDYPSSMECAALTPAQTFFVSRHGTVSRGCYVTADGRFMSVGIPGVTDGELGLTGQELKLRGRHNWENVAAASAAALLLGLDPEAVVAAAREFAGLPHRLEFAGKFGGVTFYDDSISTTPESTVAAIESFNEPLIVILGGSDKGSDYSELARFILKKNNIKVLIVLGDTAPVLTTAIKAAGAFKGQLFIGATSIGEIFHQINQAATAGDVVLLSPAAASFGLFKNYADRGNQFKRAVQLWGSHE